MTKEQKERIQLCVGELCNIVHDIEYMENEEREKRRDANSKRCVRARFDLTVEVSTSSAR